MMDVANASKIELWADSPNHYDRNLNFSAIASEDEDGNYSAYSKKSKSARDPQSHRIIEKRRRDRMNNCLADLSRLLPPAYMKKGRGRIEKTEIIEMTIKHMKHLQVHACKDIETCDIARQMEQMHNSSKMDQYRSGFLDCVAEAMQFIGHHQAAAASEHQHLVVSEDFCSRLFAHLNTHCDKVTRPASGDAHHATPGAEHPTSVQTSQASDYTVRGAAPVVAPSVNGRSHEDGIVSPPVHQDNHKVKEERSMFHFSDQSDQHSSKRTMSDSSNGESDGSSRTMKSTSSPSPPSTHTSNDGTSSELESHSSGKTSASSSSSSSSQLRQMLLSNGVPSPGASKGAKHAPAPAGHDDAGYKFKTTIQQRFTADLEHVYPPTSCLISPTSMSSSVSNGRSSTEHHEIHQQDRILFEQGLAIKRKRAEMEEQANFNKNPYGPTGQWIQQQQQQHADSLIPPPPSSSSSPPPPARSSAFHRVVHHAQEEPEEAPADRTTPRDAAQIGDTAENVPIFALHPKGAFYVPMSIEWSLIRTLFTSSPPSDVPRQLLHPVTISVNFCHPMRVITAAMMAATTNAMDLAPTVIHSPARLLRQDLVPPGLVPAVHHRAAHYEPPPVDAQTNQLLNYYAPTLDESVRMRARDIVRDGRDPATVRPTHVRQPVDELKGYRPPVAAIREEAPTIYSNGDAAVCRREYAAVIRTAGRESRSPAVPGNHSSRWSHLMAKRTHAS